MSLIDGVEFAYAETYNFLKKAWLFSVIITLPNILEKYYLYNKGFVYHQSLLDSAIWSTISGVFSGVGFYVFTRFIFLDRDFRRALSFNMASFKTSYPFLLVYTAGGVAFSVMFNDEWLWTSMFIGLFFSSLGALWAVSALGGGTVISPLTSIRKGICALPWAIALSVITALPIMILAFISGGIAGFADDMLWWIWIEGCALAIAACYVHVLTFATVNAVAQHIGLVTTRQSDLDAFA